MGKNKLKKFRELETIEGVFQFPFAVVKSEGGCPMRGHWHEHFGNTNPIVLELGCGKGEYTIGLACRMPDRNFIGIDIKGARLWKGACRMRDEKIANVAWLRTSIELLDNFFAPGEVSEIWITFPDPQMKKASKRLTGSRFLELYRRVLPEAGGIINLKTDSPFLYNYTRALLRHNGLVASADFADLHASDEAPDVLKDITTFYESQWLSRGMKIKYLQWHLSPAPSLSEPPDEIEPDTYRSFSRDRNSRPSQPKPTND